MEFVKIVQPQCPPGGGSCHHCAKKLYQMRGNWHYAKVIDDQGIERSLHIGCADNEHCPPAGADHEVYDDDELYKADLIERGRSNWVDKLDAEAKVVI